MNHYWHEHMAMTHHWTYWMYNGIMSHCLVWGTAQFQTATFYSELWKRLKSLESLYPPLMTLSTTAVSVRSLALWTTPPTHEPHAFSEACEASWLHLFDATSGDIVTHSTHIHMQEFSWPQREPQGDLWLWHSQDLNSQSRNDRANTLTITQYYIILLVLIVACSAWWH